MNFITIWILRLISFLLKLLKDDPLSIFLYSPEERAKAKAFLEPLWHTFSNFFFYFFIAINIIAFILIIYWLFFEKDKLGLLSKIANHKFFDKFSLESYDGKNLIIFFFGLFYKGILACSTYNFNYIFFLYVVFVLTFNLIFFLIVFLTLCAFFKKSKKK